MADTSPLSALRVADPTWDYRGQFTAGYTHLLHHYPAMMIPQVARRLIAEHAHRGGAILDPFCGSGGVLVEALLAGHSAWGIDLNPLGILISRVKTHALAPDPLDRDCAVLLARAAEIVERPDLALPETFNPGFANVAFWFKPPVIRQLAALRAAILTLANPAERDFFAVALAETARLVSNSRRREFKLYRYPPEQLRAHNPDALATFHQHARRSIAAMAEFRIAVSDHAAAHLLLADAGEAAAIPAGAIDLVVTSPPYGDSRTTVAYGQFSRLSAQWLYPDLLPAAPVEDRLLLGGIAGPRLDTDLPSPTLHSVLSLVAAQAERRAREVLAFYRDFYRCLASIVAAVRPGGTLCFVVGNRRVKGVQLPTDLIIAEFGRALGLRALRIIVRNIPSKRMPLRNSPSNVPGAVQDTMHQEYIVILRRYSNCR